VAESTAPGIRVNPDDLTAMARGLQGEADKNLNFQVGVIERDFLQGPGFGIGTASEPLRASHEEYAFCLESARAALGYYVDATQALVTALDLAATLYRDADAAARTGIEAADATYQGTLAQLQAQRKAAKIRDAHVIVNP
jgi:uncharacterized protein YukE